MLVVAFMCVGKLYVDISQESKQTGLENKFFVVILIEQSVYNNKGM